MATTDDASSFGQSGTVQEVPTGDREHAAERLRAAEGGEDAYARFH